jgi:peptidoglycan/LPS O-acetylase OafA/YrhL
MGFWTYLRARVVRLYPLIILGTLLGVLPYLASGRDPAYLARLSLQSILLAPEPFESFAVSMFPLNPPAWSLFHEMIASILFGLGLWRTRHLLLMPVLIGAGAIVWLINDFGTLNIGFRFSEIHLGFVRVFFGFGLGVLLYRVRNRIPVPAIPFPYLAGGLMLLLVWPQSPAWLLYICVLVIFPAIILAAARSEPRHVTLAKLSGDLSYPIYILHWPIYLGALGASILIGFAFPPLLLALAGLIAAVLGSYLALRFYDIPVRRWLSRSQARRTREAQEVRA